jgi:PAS domain S-box-containing protein
MGELQNREGDRAAGADPPTTADAAASLAMAIIESCSEAIISTALDGHIIGWNSAAAQLSGYSAAEILGQNWQFLVPPDDVKEVGRAVRRFREGEKTFRLETRLRRKDGGQL